jgi:dTDP-4-amino-4,6-dideoxygalactose transaminase
MRFVSDKHVSFMSQTPTVNAALPVLADVNPLPAIAGGDPMRSPESRLVFGAPALDETDIASVVQCLRSNWIGLGARVGRFEQEFAQYKGAVSALAVSSGSAALHLALLALGIGAGDEVIAPAMTFCSTVHAVIHTGATPILADCCRDTFNLDPEDIERRITARTKAIVAVHMCGRCCEMDRIMEIAQKYRLMVVEDCAHAIESSYRGHSAGLIGDAGCFSFYATKNLTTGDGGMIVTRNPEVLQRARTLSLHGMTADAWSRFTGGPKGYEVIEAGFKYNMTDIAASLGLPQLARLEDRWQERERVWAEYDAMLRHLTVDIPPPSEQGSRHSRHLYTVLLRLEELSVGRDQIIAALDAENIGVGIHYIPVRQQPYYQQRFGCSASDFPNAAFIGKRTLSLPLSPVMSRQDVCDVVAALARVLRYYAVTPDV